MAQSQCEYVLGETEIAGIFVNLISEEMQDKQSCLSGQPLI